MRLFPRLGYERKSLAILHSLFHHKPLAGTKGKRYAIVIDEAHSSTSGRNIIALKESLTQEEALEIAAREEVEEMDTEDKINMELERFADNSNVSFFAFTATPKGTTLRLFGTQ